MNLKTELICVGTELLEGKLNTNSSYIGDRLASIGLNLAFETTVGDNLAELKRTFEAALERSNIIIVTGGLGPTFDDLTREALAETLDRPLRLDREALSEIAAMFVKRNIDMPKNNERQAFIIEGAKLLRNALGTAPGQMVEVEKKKRKAIVFLLPGPPKEMQPLFEASVFPELKKHSRGFRKKFVLHVYGLGESAADERIRPIIDAERKIEKESVFFTILAHQSIVDIHASVRGTDEMLVDETITTLKKEFSDALGDDIYGSDRQTLESVVGELLAKNRKTLSMAESCTGGLISERITSVPGSSMYFREAAVVYSNETKHKLLGVNEETLKLYGAVSAQTAVEMAQGIKNISGTDYAVSVTGIAGPSGGTKEKPVGLVYVGICGPKIHSAFECHFRGSRSDVRQAAANKALDLLRRQIIEDHKTRI
jgi:nicotinamide-nucleotide amidase